MNQITPTQEREPVFGTALKEFELSFNGLHAEKLDAIVLNGVRFVPERQHSTTQIGEIVSKVVADHIDRHLRPGGKLYLALHR